MLRTPCVANLLSFCAAACSLCVFSNSSVEARPARNTTPAAPTAKQALIRTDLTPRNKNECLAVVQTLDDQVRRLSQQSKQGIPREFTRVASDLDQSCGKGDFKKAWISIEWMNGCLNNFGKDAELGFCSRNDGYSCALNPRSDACPQRR